MASQRPDGHSLTRSWRDATVRQTSQQRPTLAMTLLLLVPPLLLSLWGGIVILRSAHAPWQWPWGVFFIAVAFCPLLVVLGRRGLRETDVPREGGDR